MCGISDIQVAAFLVRDARSLNSWIAQTNLQASGPSKSSRFKVPFSLNYLTLFLGSLKLFIGKASQKMRSQKSKTIKKLIVAYLRSIEI